MKSTLYMYIQGRTIEVFAAKGQLWFADIVDIVLRRELAFLL